MPPKVARLPALQKANVIWARSAAPFAPFLSLGVAAQFITFSKAHIRLTGAQMTYNSLLYATIANQLLTFKKTRMETNPGNTKAKYGNKWYTIQNDRGHRHIVVRVDGKRTKITIATPSQKDVLEILYTVEGWEALYQRSLIKI